MATIEPRVSKEGTMHYRVKIRLRGHPTVSESFERIGDAKKWAQKAEVEIREGRYFTKAEAQKHTLNEAIDRYIQYLTLEKPNRLNDIKLCLTWWKHKLGDHYLSSLTKSVLSEARDDLMKEDIKRGKKVIKRSNATVNRYISALRTLLTHAENEWGWIDQNPMRSFRSLREPKGRSRFLSDNERKALLEACKESDNPYLYTIVVLAISSGARRSEITFIQWDHVHLEQQFIVLPKTKNGESRVIYLYGEALLEIQKLNEKRRKGDKYLFASDIVPNQPLYFIRAWRTALKRAKLEDFRFHDLRHTAASYLAMNGANVKDIAHILGHKSLAMTNRYAHLCNTHAARVVESMNDKIFQPVCAGMGKTI